MKYILGFLLFCAPLLAQTTVTGTITDPNGNPYANGTASATSVPNSGQKSVSTSPIATNAAGLFTMTLNAATYIFTVCAPPVNLGPTTNPTPTQVCFSSNPIAISGGSQDVSAQLNPRAKIIGPAAAGVTSGGTPGQFAVYGTASSIAADQNLDDGVTTPSAITSDVPIAMPQANLTGTGGLAVIGPGGTLPTPGANQGGIGIAAGAIPQINPNNAGWFAIPYITVGGSALPATANNTNFSNSTPSAPTNGINVQWLTSGQNISAAIVGDGNAAHALCGNGTFGACTAGGATALSGITAAAGANSISSGNFGGQTWQWALTTNSVNALNITESAAGSATSASLLNISTAAGSTVTPLTVANSLTGTQTLPALVISPTWNTTGVVDAALLVNVTNTASASGSLLADFQVGGSSKLNIDKAGDLSIVGSVNSNTLVGNLVLCGANGNVCGPTSSNAVLGGIIAGGGDNSNTGSSAKGGVAIFRGGMLTNAAPNAAALEGVVQLGSGFLKGSAVAALGDVVCGTSTAFTVTDCSHTGPAVNIIGIANTTSNPIGVVADGQALVATDGAVTIGHVLCMGTTTDGQAHDNGTAACATAGTTIGVVIATSGTIIQMSGQSTASTAMSTTLPLVQLHIGQ